VPEGIFQGFPIQLVVGHFLERIAGQDDLAVSWLFQPEQLS
jgi:hypothetical protein